MPPKLLREIPIKCRRLVKIQDYEEAVRLDAQGWFYELFRRLIGTEDSPVDFSKYPPYGLLPKECMDRVHVGKCLSDTINDPLIDLPSVQSLRYTDVLALARAEYLPTEIWDPEEYDCFPEEIKTGLHKQPFDEFTLLRLKAKADTMDPEHRDGWLWVFAGTKKHVYIDLTAPVEQIFSDLRIWLAEARKRLLPKMAAPRKAARNRLKTGDFRRWAQIGVLPYLDLKHWAEQNNVRFPSYVIGRYIRPQDKVDPTEAARTAEEKSAEILTFKTLQTLLIQIDEEKKHGVKTS
jgi:hypothetical protein